MSRALSYEEGSAGRGGECEVGVHGGVKANCGNTNRHGLKVKKMGGEEGGVWVGLKLGDRR